MDTRVEKYSSIMDQSEDNMPSRSERNQELYRSINNCDISNFGVASNTKVIENIPKKIDLEKIKKYIDNIEETQKEEKRKFVIEETPLETRIEQEDKKEKVYDINTVLEKAKKERENYYENEKYKKLRDTQYDILSKIDVLKSEDEPEDISFNTNERTLIDLINTVAHNQKTLDLLSELKGNETEEKVGPMKEESPDDVSPEAIKDEIQKQDNTLVKEMDKSFYTNSMSFAKEDFDGFEELEKTVKKNNVLVKISVIFLILLAIVTAYIIIKYLF